MKAEKIAKAISIANIILGIAILFLGILAVSTPYGSEYWRVGNSELYQALTPAKTELESILFLAGGSLYILAGLTGLYNKKTISMILVFIISATSMLSLIYGIHVPAFLIVAMEIVYISCTISLLRENA